MKLRVGFVSNSSTTSFCIYGVRKDGNDIRKMMLAKDMWDKGEIGRQDLYGLMYKLEDSIKNLELHIGQNEDFIYIGKNRCYMDPDETRNEFELSVKKALEELFGESQKCQDYLESWFNG